MHVTRERSLLISFRLARRRGVRIADHQKAQLRATYADQGDRVRKREPGLAPAVERHADAHQGARRGLAVSGRRERDRARGSMERSV